VPARELLGPWFVQVALVLGVLFFIVTTIVMRTLLPKLNHWRGLASGTARDPAGLKSYRSKPHRPAHPEYPPFL